MERTSDPAAFHLRISLLHHAIRQTHEFMRREPVWDIEILRGYCRALTVLDGAAKLCAHDMPRDNVLQACRLIEKAHEACMDALTAPDISHVMRDQVCGTLTRADELAERSLLENYFQTPDLEEELQHTAAERLDHFQRDVPGYVSDAFNTNKSQLEQNIPGFEGDGYHLSTAYTAVLAYHALAVYLPAKTMAENSGRLLTLLNNMWRGLSKEWQKKSALPMNDFHERYLNVVGTTILERLHSKILKDLDSYDWTRALRNYPLTRPDDSATVHYLRGAAAEKEMGA